MFSIDRRLEKGSWLDYGMFLQTIMLAARARGLHTCAEASIASYPDIVRRELGIAKENIVICGMAMGYADPEAIVNRINLVLPNTANEFNRVGVSADFYKTKKYRVTVSATCSVFGQHECSGTVAVSGRF